MLTLAYLNTEYPALSHTFVAREIRAIREGGLRVQPFSVRKTRPNTGAVDSWAEERAETISLLDRPTRLLSKFTRAIFTRPLRVLRCLRTSQSLSPPGVRERFRHFVYAMEGVRLAEEMKSLELTHVHVHMANNGAMVALLACVFESSISYSLTIHGSAEFFDVHRLALKEKAENAVFVRCISDFCRAQVMTWTSNDSWSRFHVVHCGVDVEKFSPRPAADDDSSLRLLAVGRFVPIKAYPLLLEACSGLDDQGVEWSLELVGSGPLREELETRAKRLGIEDRVRFPGPMGEEQITAVFDRSNVLVVSSFMEGVPVVLMEAMAKELAVVATRVGGVQELVEDGVSGWLVSPSSVEDLTTAFVRAYQSRKTLRDMGREGRRRVRASFDASANGREMRRLFDRYVADSRGAAVSVGGLDIDANSRSRLKP